MSMEKRNYYRSKFQIKRNDNVIYLKRNQTIQPISGELDLSNYGLGVVSDQAITTETPVTIELKAFELHLSVFGTVRWCTAIAEQEKPYRLGIEFDSTQSQDNKLFSFALRRHLKKIATKAS